MYTIWHMRISILNSPKLHPAGVALRDARTTGMSTSGERGFSLVGTLVASSIAVLLSTMAFEVEAEIVADRLVEADLRGIHSHGSRRLKNYIDAIENPDLKEKALALIKADTTIPDGVMEKSEMLMRLGEPELALDHLERAFEEGDSYAVHMKRINVYAPLSENPRFQAMLKKMNLWP